MSPVSGFVMVVRPLRAATAAHRGDMSSKTSSRPTAAGKAGSPSMDSIHSDENLLLICFGYKGNPAAVREGEDGDLAM